MACSNHHEDTHSADHDVSHKTQKRDEAPSNPNVDNHVDEAEHGHERRFADAHTHGDAELAIVLDGNDVTIELESPLYNILGFENAPETDAQTVTVEQAELQLEQGEGLFTFNAKANCLTVSNDLHVTLFNDHNEEDEHDEDHDEETHKDVLLTYEFSCQNPAKLKNVTINLFEFFPELSEVHTTYLGPATQKQLVLTRKQRQMDITP